jgi:aminobenzoyl-glutamate utilization protein B
MDPRKLTTLAAHEVSRRGLLQGAGAVGVGALGLAVSDPVHAATAGYDERIGVTAELYQPPTGLAKPSAAKDAALGWVSANQDQLVRLNDRIWEWAELSLREWQSSVAVAELLSQNGFTIRWGTAGFPAAFVATFQNGRGGPVLGFNGEYDALPGLSQRAGAGTHDPIIYNYDAYGPTYGPGHGDGHNLLGVACAGAAIAAANGLRRQNLNATLKYFGSTGEEHLVGKAYAVRAGAYNGLDAFMDWHPLPVTSVDWSPFSALQSTTFTFLGAAGHGGSPLGNRSGLDGALLMASMTEFLREKNVGPAGRIHYAVINGGGAPNVTPDMCSIWYYVREGSPARLKVLHDKIVTCANAAASASQTRLSYRLNSAVWNLLGNKAAAELVFDNMQIIGPPRFSAGDVAFARSLQRALGRPEVGLPDSIVPLTPPRPTNLGGPSSDAADVSWITPRVGFYAACWPPGVPNHNWAATACTAHNIGHQGMLAATRYLTATAIDLITDPDLLAGIKEEHRQRREGVQWRSLLPDDAQPPIYQPPAEFLRRTGQSWPPPGIRWPVEPIIAHEQLGTTGPDLPPVT